MSGVSCASDCRACSAVCGDRDARIDLPEPRGEELRLRRIVLDHQHIGGGGTDLGECTGKLREATRQVGRPEDGIHARGCDPEAIELVGWRWGDNR